MRRIWILAGESSGDMYGARLAEGLRRLAAERGEELELSGMGGKAMMAAGIPVKVDSTELGVMGVFEVCKILFTIIGVFRRLVKAAAAERPDAVILIDYPGFNLRFAKKLHRLGIPVIWYISPQVWVWGKRRLPVLEKVCRKMLVIFPFETEVYGGTQLETEFVGHPLIDLVEERRDPAIMRDPDAFLLLPGSRSGEISRLLEPMLSTVTILAQRHKNLHYHLSAPRPQLAEQCREICEKFRSQHPDLPEISITVGDTAKWQQQAGTGLAASGTVTVESAIAGLPLVVGYRMSFCTMLLAAFLVKLYRGFFTMVNIIADGEVFPEFLQYRFTPECLVPAIEKLLPGGSDRAQVEAGMRRVVDLLRPDSGSAARQAALACWQVIETAENPANGADKDQEKKSE